MRIIAAMVTAGEPSLAAAVASVRPHVDAVVGIVTDPERAEFCFPLFDACQVATVWNWPAEKGPWTGLRDFGAARNASFELAEELGADWIVWLDSDDELLGGENLRPALALLDSAPRARVLARYEYAFDEERGEVLVEQWRERAIKAGTPYRWHRPVHEHLVADDGENADVKLESVAWRHRRPLGGEWSDRNLRILRWHWGERGDAAAGDAWLRLNLGLELFRAREFAEALSHLEAYVELSANDAERAMACTVASRAALALGPTDRARQEEALSWADRAVELRPSFETMFELAKVLFARGATGDREEMENAAACLTSALQFGETETPYAVSPVDFRVTAPEMLRVAHESMGDYAAAAEATRALLEHRPGDALYQERLRDYEERLRPRAEGGERSLEIVFVCGPTVEPWNPRTAAEGGIGGSETAVIEVSRRLRARGHRVRVACDTGEPEAVHDGVVWQPSPFAVDPGEPDVLVCWRDAHFLEFGKRARSRVVWAHDVQIGNMTPERALWADRVLGLSEWHCGQLREMYRLAPGQVVRTRNGIDLARFYEGPDYEGSFVSGEPGSLKMAPRVRDPHRVIYSSSPDRGLAVLLDVWPKIVDRVPDAKLDVFYGFQGLADFVARAGKHELLRYYLESMRMKLGRLPGVRHRGRVDQLTLAREMMVSGVWAYPTWWTETSCISAMEAQAAGLRIVTSPIAALRETVGDRGVMIEGDWLTYEYQDEFVSAVVDAMLAPEPREGESHGWPSRAALRAHARESFSWDGVADEWDALFRSLAADADLGSLPAYGT